MSGEMVKETPISEYEKTYGEVMAKILGYRSNVSLHRITSPYWDAATYVLTFYDPAYKKYDKEAVLTHAINQVMNKLRRDVGYSLREKLAESLRGILRFLLDYADRYPSSKAWAVARAIRRSLAEHYYEEVWRYWQEKQEKKAESSKG